MTAPWLLGVHYNFLGSTFFMSLLGSIFTSHGIFLAQFWLDSLHEFFYSLWINTTRYYLEDLLDDIMFFFHFEGPDMWRDGLLLLCPELLSWFWLPDFSE